VLKPQALIDPMFFSSFRQPLFIGNNISISFILE
jgi:hypothetical protein